MRLSAGLLDDSLTVEHGQRGFGTLLARALGPKPPRRRAWPHLGGHQSARFAERGVMERRPRRSFPA
jgi:hypothetical protein